jgi:predicted nuclease of predicted toxin-antitoxin system
MKLKLDENLPESLVVDLTALGHDVDNVRMEGLSGRSDPSVWHAAQEATRFFITQDLDFSDARKFAPGNHYGLMLVRLRVPGRQALATRVAEAFRRGEPETWARCFVVLTDHKLRIRRAPEK